MKADGLMNGLFGVAGGFVFDLQDAAVPEWAYGVGVGFDVVGAAIGVSLNGSDVDTLNQLGVDVDYAFAPFGVIFAAGFSFADGADTFQGLDAGVYVKAGGAKWQVGYLYRPEGSGYAYSWTPAEYYGAPVGGAPEGGLYFLADIDF